eukprot:GHVS01016771.1.p1 GENE.GHVS01016771.1~~GHVS01016771.1.p1  ORF type:complete len:132 (+),score=7.98 GHVS01016771.1:42-398(+)
MSRLHGYDTISGMFSSTSRHPSLWPFLCGPNCLSFLPAGGSQIVLFTFLSTVCREVKHVKGGNGRMRRGYNLCACGGRGLESGLMAGTGHLFLDGGAHLHLLLILNVPNNRLVQKYIE